MTSKFRGPVAVLCLMLSTGSAAQVTRPVLRALYIPFAKTELSGQQVSSLAFGNDEQVERGSSTTQLSAAHGVVGNGKIGHYTEGMLTLDGRLDEAVWDRAEAATNFRQREPNEGELATEKTEVHVLYDREYLYIGFRCFDSEPGKIVATEMRNDAELDNDDHVRVVIDTYLDRRNGFVFETNPLGARRDALVSDEGRNVNDDWNIVWEVNASRTPQGWEAEMRIPLGQLRYPKSHRESRWGINFARVIRRKQEDTYWAPITRDFGFGSRAFYKISRAGDLVGLEHMPHHNRLEIKGYNLSGFQRDRSITPVENQGVFDAGLDIKFALTRNLIADLTLNTDFAQVEADQEQVNLTRFSLFFPEKRDFFLEGAGVFRVGSSSTRGGGERGSDLLFYSRRIGLAGGRQVPILAGAKITGNLGGFEVGVLNVLTDEAVDPEEPENSQPRANYAAIRINRPVFANSSVGFLLLSRDALTEPPVDSEFKKFNRTFAVDGNFAVGPSLTINTWLAKTAEPDIHGQDFAGNFSFNYRTDRWTLRSSFTNIEENFNAAMGFIRRVDIRKTSLEIGRGVRPPQGHWMQRIYNAPTISYLTDTRNNLLTRELGIRTFLQFRDGHVLFSSPKQVYDVLEDDWEIYSKDERSIVIPKGIYTYYTYDFFFRSDESKPLSVRLGGNLGEFFSGQRYGSNLDVVFKPSAHVAWSTGYDINRVLLPNGSFTTQVLSTRFIYTFSRNMFAKAFIQWNDTRETLSLNFLYNFYYRPGSDIYLVYNHVWHTGGPRPESMNRALMLKVTYWWNR